MLRISSAQGRWRAGKKEIVVFSCVSSLVEDKYKYNDFLLPISTYLICGYYLWQKSDAQYRWLASHKTRYHAGLLFD